MKKRIPFCSVGSLQLAAGSCYEDGSTVLFGEARDLLAKLVRLEAVLTNGQDCESGQIDVSTADVTRCSVLD